MITPPLNDGARPTAVGRTASPRPVPEPPAAGGRRYSGLAVLGQSALAATALALLLAAGIRFSSGTLVALPPNTGDQITQQEAAARQTAFAAQSSLDLSLVRDAEVPKAVANMGLQPREQSALLQRLGVPAPAAAAAPAATPTPAATAKPSAQPAGMALAWITLWDTDAEDGDVVRIDSGGYSRTITLSKQPVTIAVPVPHDSVISVTGIRDGEGGGITVGLASGASRAVFPIMSVGQTLGLRAQFN